MSLFHVIRTFVTGFSTRAVKAAEVLTSPRKLTIKIADSLVVSPLHTIVKLSGKVFPKFRNKLNDHLVNAYVNNRQAKQFIEERLTELAKNEKGIKNGTRVKNLIGKIRQDLNKGVNPNIAFERLNELTFEDYINVLGFVLGIGAIIREYFRYELSLAMGIASLVAFSANKQLLDISDDKVRFFIKEGPRATQLPEPLFMSTVWLLGHSGENPKEVASFISSLNLFEIEGDELMLASSNIFVIAKTQVFEDRMYDLGITKDDIAKLVDELNKEVDQNNPANYRDALSRVGTRADAIVSKTSDNANNFLPTAGFLTSQYEKDFSNGGANRLGFSGGSFLTQSGAVNSHVASYQAGDYVNGQSPSERLLIYEEVKTMKETYDRMRKILGLSRDEFREFVIFIRSFDLDLI